MIKSIRGWAGQMALAAAMSAFAVLSTAAHPAMAGDNPFSGYAGRWVGGGTITTKDGKSESLKCRVTYFTEGASGVRQTIRCASSSYKFEVRSSVTSSGGKLAGDWTEETRSVSGVLSGSMSGSNIRLRVSGENFSAGMTVSLSGGSQSVVISPQGLDVTSISMGLHKG